ncbi:T9SS type A sorting domain-containing protein [Spirosoma gilvum]
MKTFLLICSALVSTQVVQATHLLGGYIQAKSVAGSALTYEVTLVLYMNTSTAATSQTTSSLICFGDGSSATATRVSQQAVTLSSPGLYSGVTISQYRIIHTYAGPGTYTLATSIANRTPSKNILNSDTQQEPLTLTTTFSTVSASNQTPTLSIPATGFEVALAQKAVLSLKATDADGDSLVYELAKASTSNANDACNYHFLSTYQFPNDLTHQGTYKLNSRTGEFVWDAPVQQGYYSIVYTVNEYRNGVLISQTTQEIPLVVEDRPGTPTPIPSYEPAILGNGSVVTGTTPYADPDILFVTFPNPVDGPMQVVIRTSNPTTATIQLTDVNGRKVHELTFSKASRQHEQVIGMDSLTPGVYMIRADVNGRSLLRKIVKR